MAASAVLVTKTGKGKSVMGAYHCERVSEQLQSVPGLLVKDRDHDSWTFAYKSAKAKVRVLPGCCGIMLFYQLSGVDKDLLRLLQYACKAATKANFGLVLLSLKQTSTLRGLLPAATWPTINFTNPRTRNEIALLSYQTPVKMKAEKPQRYGHEDA
jgi:hypothetical protein